MNLFLNMLIITKNNNFKKVRKKLDNLLKKWYTIVMRENKNKGVNKMAKEKINVYEIITNKIIEQLDRGICPWKRTWKGEALEPKNVRGTGYRGINKILLAFSEYASPYWLTYKQAKELGGQVRKGEKATPVTYWNFFEKEVTKNGETKKKRIGFLKYYNVFNL